MSRQRSLSVTDATNDEFARLKVRLAVTNGNRIPQVSAMIAALITVGENHYDELAAELRKDATE